MIIQIRGTSGSGKSTIVREIMAKYDYKMKIKEEGRRQPIGYLLPWAAKEGRQFRPSLYVPGHYETPCGGCDTIPNMDKIYDHIRQAAEQGHDVLFEGLLISAEVARCVQLAEDHEVHVFGLTKMDVNECVDSVNERRRAKRGPDAPGVNPKNTVAKHKQTARAMQRLEEESCASTYHVNREECIEMISSLLAQARVSHQ